MEAAPALRWLLVLVAVVRGARESIDTDEISDAKEVAPALLQRANGSSGAWANLSKLDVALSRKGGEDDESTLTPCVCFVEQVELDHPYMGNYFIEFTDLDDEGKFESQELCAAGCPVECHKKLKYKFDPKEARAVGAEQVVMPMTAAQCSDEGKCVCMDADETTKLAKVYTKREEVRTHIAQLKEVHDSPEECLKSCACKDKKVTSPWSSMEYDFEGLCMDEWHWNWFLRYDSEPFCYPRKAVGLVSCDFTQQFVLKDDLKRAGHAYKAKLERLEDSSGNEVAGRMNLKVVKFEAEEGYYRTASVTVGPKGAKIKWKVYKSALMSRRWTWRVADEHGEERFTINQQSYGNVWKVYDGTKSEGNHLYYAYGNGGAKADSQGVLFKFYRDHDRTHYAGAMQDMFLGEGDAGDKYKVTVQPNEDAGVILIACALIDKSIESR